MRLFILIKRDPRETAEEFLRWWSDHHANLAKEMPGLKRYVLHEVKGGFEKDTDWDGLAELEFASIEAARAAFKSEAGLRLLDDAKHKRGARLMLSTEYLRVVRES